MKKILFLMLSLAVSASAFAGVDVKHPVKGAPAPVSKYATHMVKMDAPAPILQMINKQQQKSIFDFDDVKDRPVKNRAVQTETPEGTVTYYQRSAGTSIHRYYDSTAESPWGGIEYGDQADAVIAVENGSTIWFKNLLYDPDHFWDDYWIKGTKQGTRVTIELNQEIYVQSSMSVVLGKGTLVYDNGFTFTPNTSGVIRFNLDGNTMTLAESEYDGNYGGTCIAAYITSTGGWTGFADFATELTVDDNVPEAPTIYTDDDIAAMAENGGTLAAYARSGEATILYEGDVYFDTQSGATLIYFASDGETVYMRDPVYGIGYSVEESAWVKGTVSGNKITVDLNQYVYWDEEFVGLRTVWGTVSTLTGFTADETVTQCTYTIGEKNITLDNATDSTGLALMQDSRYVDQGWYGCIDWNTVYWNAPDVPANVTAEPTATTAKITWDGGETEQWNLRYRQYNPGTEYYSCDFEDASEWGIIDADGDGKYWGYRSGETSAGDGYCLTSASWDRTAGALTPDNWLISPEVALNGVVRFKAWGQDPDYPSEVFAVYVTTNADYQSTSDFVALSEDFTALPWDSINAGAGNTYNIDLSAYAGQRGCIAIRHYNVTDMFYLNVDDFFVGDPDAPVYEWVEVDGITEIPYTIEGLNPETEYEVQVAGVNGEAIGVWTESTIFTTLAEQTGKRGDVNDDGNINIQDVTALISHMLAKNWDNVPGEFNYDNADADLNGTVNIQDVTTLINYLLSKSWPAN